jgi:hypothetical protein
MNCPVQLPLALSLGTLGITPPYAVVAIPAASAAATLAAAAVAHSAAVVIGV